MSKTTNIVGTVKLTILFLMVQIIVIESGCKISPTTPTYEPSYIVPVDKYVFLERKIIFDGFIIEGQYTGPLAHYNTTYNYDSLNGIINGLIEFPITDSLIVIFGHEEYLLNAAGSGAVSKLFGIYNLPYQNGAMIFSSIKSDESIQFKYRDSLFNINKKQKYEIITSRLDTIGTAIVLFTKTETITNFGFQLKSKIYKWKMSHTSSLQNVAHP